MRLALVGQTYLARSTAAAAQTKMNVYPEPIEDPNEKAKGNAFLVGRPGTTLFKDLTTISALATPVRGVWSGGGRVFVAAGTVYFEIDSAGNLVGSINAIADDADHTQVFFFVNGNQLFIISAGVAYVDNGAGPTAISLPACTGTVTALNFFVDWVSGDYFDAGMVGQTITIGGGVGAKVVDQVLSSTTLTITTTAGGAPVTSTYSCSPLFAASSGAYLDGYFIASRSNSTQFNISALLDGTNGGTYVWDPLDFGRKESYPDYIRSILVSGEQLYIFGTESFELWQNTGGGALLPGGGAPFPFERINGATGKFGSVSRSGPIAIAGRVFFLGGDSTGQICAYEMKGANPDRVSTHAEEWEWNAAGFGPTAVSYGYLEDGHYFWVINFGSGGFAWAFDLETGAWHQRAGLSGSSFAPYGVCYHTFVTNEATSTNNWGSGGQHIVGSTLNGNLYVSSINTYSDAGADIKWQVTIPYLYNSGNTMYFGRMTLDMQTGTVASGAEPTISRDYSDNRGRTFVNPQTAGIGVHDDSAKRVFWPVCGSSRERNYRFTGQGQSKVALVALDCDVTMGVN